MLDQLSKLKDYSFFNRVMFLFENNRYVNSIFVNEIKDREYSDFSNCINITFDNERCCIVLEDKSSNGLYISSSIRTHVEEESFINNIFLVVDEDKPTGTDIIYYIFTNENDKIRILPNNNSPLILDNYELPKEIILIAELYSNTVESPTINSFSLMYYDNITDKNLNLATPNIEGEYNFKDI